MAISEGGLNLELPVDRLGHSAESDRFRVGRTVLELVLKRSISGIALLVMVSFGPPVAIAVGLAAGARGVGLTVDGISLSGEVARFLATGRHEVRWDEVLPADHPGRNLSYG